MSLYWSNFAKSGDPNKGLGVAATWPSMTPHTRQTMIFSTTAGGVVENYHAAECDYLDTVRRTTTQQGRTPALQSSECGSSPRPVCCVWSFVTCSWDTSTKPGECRFRLTLAASFLARSLRSPSGFCSHALSPIVATGADFCATHGLAAAE